MTDALATGPHGILGALDGRTFAAVIFDMDGTLVDSTPAVARCWVRLAQEEGIDPVRLTGFHGIPARGIVEAVFPEARWDACFERILALELADTDGVVPLPGAVAALAAISALDPARVAIATSCTRDLADVRLAASGLLRPDVVVTFDDTERGKPHPDPFLEASRRLGVDPTQCLVVEDAPGGLVAARAAGCATLALMTTTPRDELVADAVVGTLADVRFAAGGRLTVSAASGR